MKRETSTQFALSVLALGLMLSTSLGLAQDKLGTVRRMRPQAWPAAQAKTQNHSARAGSPSYTFTVLAFPGTFFTGAAGINLGAATSKIEIVGGDGWGEVGYTGGFSMSYAGTKGHTTESFREVNKPGEIGQGANDVNDFGDIVGYYIESGTTDNGYLESKGKFTTIDVPFSGSEGNSCLGINNSGEIVGTWEDSTTSHGFVFNGGTYSSFDYPSSTFTAGLAVNNSGVIVGAYTDASGVTHAFMLSGGTYTSYDPPGSTYTVATGINDSGDIVGYYCQSSECAAGDGYPSTLGFLLSGGTYTNITVPDAVASYAFTINNNGVIVGEYADGVAGSNGGNGFLATP